MFVPAPVFERVNALRRAVGISWVEVLEAAEKVLEEEREPGRGEPAPMG